LSALLGDKRPVQPKVAKPGEDYPRIKAHGVRLMSRVCTDPYAPFKFVTVTIHRSFTSTPA
jgi:hypothetical protein